VSERERAERILASRFEAREMLALLKQSASDVLVLCEQRDKAQRALLLRNDWDEGWDAGKSSSELGYPEIITAIKEAAAQQQAKET
jgi:hypothetical protein